MDLNNFYYYFTSAISPEDCDRIIDTGLNKIKENKKQGINTAATTLGYSHKQALKKNKKKTKSIGDKTAEDIKKVGNLDNFYIRDSEISWLGDKWIYDLIYPYIHIANEKAGWNFEFDYAETFQFTKYGLNQFYGWHTDGIGDHLAKYKRFIPGVHTKNKDGNMPPGYTIINDYIGKVRKISITINLSKPESYEGGNLKFDFGPHATKERFHECMEIRPRGSIIVFPSFLHHQVTPVKKGTRYSLVVWVLGQPFK
jgi:PKHD-type hydroxylase